MPSASQNVYAKPYFDIAVRSGWSRGRENNTRVELTRGGHCIYLVPRVASVSIAADPRLKMKLAAWIEREDFTHSGLDEFAGGTGIKLAAMSPTDFGALLKTL